MKTSKKGYLRNSPDVNNPQNIIKGGNITMKGVDFKVHGVDNNGYAKVMTPGYDYNFPNAKYVTETPIKNKEMNGPFKMKPGRGSMPKTGRNLPLSMVSPLYQNDIKIKPGTKRVDRNKRKETAQQMAQAALAGENVEGYTKSGRKKLEVFKKGDIIDTKGRKGGTYGRGTGRSTADVSELSEKKLTRQINRQLRKTGSVSVKDGVVEGGVTITKPMTEAQKKKKSVIDKKRAQNQIKKAKNQKILADKKAKLIAEREAKKSASAKAKSERIASLEAKKEQRKTKKS
jgi:hypothetical protein